MPAGFVSFGIPRCGSNPPFDAAMTFGYLLIALIVLAFLIGFVNFQGRAKRQLQQYEFDTENLTRRLKEEQRARENAEALIQGQTGVIAEAEERIGKLEEKLARLERLAERLESLAERYEKLDPSKPKSGEE